MNKTLLLIAASAAAVFGTPAIAAVDVAPSPQSYSASTEVLSNTSTSIVENAENFKKRGSFRRGFRGRRHGGFGRRHRGFSRHRGVIGGKKHFKHDVKRFRHHDRFRHNDNLHHNRRFIHRDRLHHDQNIQHKDSVLHGDQVKHGHHDHHDAQGKVVIKKKG